MTQETALGAALKSAVQTMSKKKQTEMIADYIYGKYDVFKRFKPLAIGIEKDLEEFYSFDEIINEYKTQEVMHMERNTILKNSYEKNSQERYEYGFIDFFIMKNLGEI